MFKGVEWVVFCWAFKRNGFFLLAGSTQVRVLGLLGFAFRVGGLGLGFHEFRVARSQVQGLRLYHFQVSSGRAISNPEARTFGRRMQNQDSAAGGSQTRIQGQTIRLKDMEPN